MAAKKIIFSNQKGGVGKTTTAVNLGGILRRKATKFSSYLDSRGTCPALSRLTRREAGSYDVIVGKCNAQDAYQETPVPNLYAIGGGIDLAGLSVELVNELAREFFFEECVVQERSEWIYPGRLSPFPGFGYHQRDVLG
jgi:chromosome partitioning protein